MAALEGSPERRAAGALDAGSDIVLHCNGELSGMETAVRGCRRMTRSTMSRLERAWNAKANSTEDLDPATATRQVGEFLENRADGA